jgi:biopolymer transport protein ExbD
MGGVSLPGGGGKRSLDFDLNLVPFIDLLSCCISFLLITAVWTQLAKIETSQSSDPASRSNPDPPPKVQIVIDGAGYALRLPGETASLAIPKRSTTDYNRADLRKKLAQLKVEQPAASIVGIAPIDDTAYQEVVAVMDICVSVGLRDISLGQVESLRALPAKAPGG